MAYRSPGTPNLASLLDAACAAHRQGNIEGAVAAYRQVLVHSPDHGPALSMLGTGLLQLGKPADAIAYLERAVRQQRRNAHLLGNLAQAYMAIERYAEAQVAFRKAGQLAPEAVQFKVGTAAVLALQGRLADAEAILRRLSLRFPNAALVWFNLGNVLRDSQRFEDALEAYRKASHAEPQMIEARNASGSVLHSLLRFGEAEAEYRWCVEAAPDYLPARYNLAAVRMDLGDFTAAEAVCREIVRRQPDLPDAHRLLGTALGHQARLLDALACYRRAAEMAPDDGLSAQAYGGALMEVGRAAAGLRWLARAAGIDPQSLALKRVTGGALLAHGCLQDGWVDYASRPGAVELREKHRVLAPVQSLAGPLAGKSVCVLAEQGLGDQLFFLRYAPQLARLGARVVHRASRKLHTLLQRVAAFDAVLPEDADLPRADVYILAGDLPLALGERAHSALAGPGTRGALQGTLTDFARNIAVFSPAPAETLRIPPLQQVLADMRERLAALGPAPYIGVTWRGGTAPEKQQTSSGLLYKSIGIPALGLAVRAVAGTIVALQREPQSSEMEALAAAAGRPVHDFSALNDDLEGMLAVLALLDEYVGVSNTNMHLRAAAGRTARVLVPVPAEWRWMRSGRYSPWFPGFTIYRQSLQGHWGAALESLQSDLEVGYGTTRAPGDFARP